MKNLNAIGVFVRVAESGSFTIAAQRLGMSPSGVSKFISHLEKELGVRLANRTTRKVSLTEEGEHFYERCRHLLNEIEETEALLTRTRIEPRGRVRLHVPFAFGRIVVMPALVEFTKRYPSVAVDVELSDRNVDMIEERLDVMIAIGEQNDSRLIARKLCNFAFVYVASPAYLRAHGEPKTPDDLANHRCLGFVDLKLGRYRSWFFNENGQRKARDFSGHLNANSAESLLDAVIAGAGIATMASFVPEKAVLAGEAKIVLKKFIAEGPPVYVVYVPSPYLSPRVRAMVDFLRELIPETPSWDRVVLGDPEPKKRGR